MNIKEKIENIGCAIAIIAMILFFLSLIYMYGYATLGVIVFCWENFPIVLYILIPVLLFCIGRFIYKKVREYNEDKRRKEAQKERKRQEEAAKKLRQQQIKKYKQIQKDYPNCYYLLRKFCSDKTVEERMMIAIKNEELYKKYEKEIVKEKKLQMEKDQVYNNYFIIRDKLLTRMKRRNGIPYYYFFNYYPKNQYYKIAMSNEMARRFITLFKEGKRVFTENVVIKIKSVFDYNLEAFTFVCIPPSNHEMYSIRYKEFMSRVCEKTGMINGFDHVSVIKDISQNPFESSNNVNYDIDSVFFNGKVVVVFDDIINSGNSLNQMILKLEKAGARVIAAFFLGETVGHLPNQDEHHPWLDDEDNPKRDSNQEVFYGKKDKGLAF